MSASLLGDLGDFRAIFFDEATEHLETIDSLLLNAEKSVLGASALNEIFRAAHSIKGSSGMLGFTELVSLTHVLENLLDLLRKDERASGQRDIDAMLRASDVARLQIAHRRGSGGAPPPADEVEAELRALAAATPGLTRARRFKVRLGALAAPIAAGELDMLMAGLADLGTLSGQKINNTAGGEISFNMKMVGMEADLVSILSLVVAPELVRVTREAPPKPRQATRKGAGSALPTRDPQRPAPSVGAGAVSAAGAVPAGAVPGALPVLAVGSIDADGGEIFVDPARFKKRRSADPATSTAAAPVTPAATDSAQPRVGESAASGQIAAAAPVDLFITAEQWRTQRDDVRTKRHSQGRRRADYEEALPEKTGRREADKTILGAVAAEGMSIRVSIEKIDRLVNLAGELVITEAMLTRSLSQQDMENRVNGESVPGLSDLARHTRNLQEAIMAVRMVPIAAVFARFPRLVRELAQRLGKEAEVHMSGEATELDRGLIEKITDPLTHLVRNAIDHGLETTEVRAAAGKPRAGVILLSASQRGGNIVIEVRDDGNGLDRARILARARERGLAIDPNAPDEQVWQVLFEPGFSTVEVVTDVSGRGVGMDVVRRNIQTLGGNVELASQAGQSTAVTLTVPLTLAIMEAMTIGSCGEIYALPLTAVIESRQLADGEVRDVAGQGRTLRVRGEYLPVLGLAALFPPPPGAPAPTGKIALIVEAEGGRAALIVDELIGQQQVVVKSLEANFRRVAGLAGATIMGDGKVALILDMGHIVRSASSGTVI